MTAAGIWLHRVMFRSIGWGLFAASIGAVLALAVVVPLLTRPSALVVENLREADGVIARGGQIDLVGVRTGTSTCPGATQRYLWRELEMDGVKTTQLIPLQMTVLPAYMPNGPTMISLPVPNTVSDGMWFYRAVTMERCDWLPTWLGGATIRRSADVSVEIKG